MPLYNITSHNDTIIAKCPFKLSKIHISLLVISLQSSYFPKRQVPQENTEAAGQKCFIKEAVLKTVWKIHKKSLVQRFSFRARSSGKVYGIFPVSFPRIFRTTDLKVGILFIIQFSLSLFPVYLEWTKSSLRTTLIQSTREHLLVEVLLSPE